MTIDVYSATGTKKGTLELPAALFGATVNRGLMHQALVAQQSNRRSPIAHAKTRGEVVGSTWDPLESTCRHASLSIL